MSDPITIRSNLQDSRRVAVWERDSRHPNGEIFVTGKRGDVQAFPTSAVTSSIRSGRLIQVNAEQPLTESPAVSEINGIGPSTEAKLNEAGIYTIADFMAVTDLNKLSEQTGISASVLSGWQNG